MAKFTPKPPTNHDRVTFTINLTPELRARIGTAANNAGLTANALIRQAIEYALDNMEEEKT